MRDSKNADKKHTQGISKSETITERKQSIKHTRDQQGTSKSQTNTHKGLAINQTNTEHKQTHANKKN